MSVYQRETIDLILRAHEVGIEAPSLYHGDCIGVDEQVHDIAAKLGFKINIYPPIDERFRAHCIIGNVLIADAPRDYMTRNRNIVNACEHLLVVPESAVELLRSGTWSTYRYARKVHKQFTIITPGGEDPILLED
jgi:predicted Rossmann fold nucleotide-binding protein DprA/Smf involved in DNA uptake